MKFLVYMNFIFVSLSLSCSYYSLSGSIPTHIKSIHIPLFENQTSEFDLAENITDFIIEQFNESGVLRIENDRIKSDPVAKANGP